ncbi:hypothetical protein BX661DRAFT_182973 [Kickxella alabastrina]|uniref:uncharacterized protein n=1 Tax=Kickxella alabastrina TaxID=61397 RepID=UPI00221F00AA|nr:uncharacterized protein BX661DRAFT_182973 [Kickxella alabastrina]KAI7827277.1 hypothetical protein BX661DRAFT_182973 [Kickxella alabastrina]
MQQATEIVWPETPEFGVSPINLFVPTWTYSDRYNGQPIVPHILLGPYHLVRRAEFLQLNSIHHILCIRDPSEQLFLREIATNPPTEFHIIDVPAIIIPHFIQANAMLAGMVRVGRTDGIDKSASFVAAYLMNTFALQAVDAVTFVQNHRYCATPSPGGYKIKLSEYEPICAAQRSSAGNSGQEDANVTRRRDSEDEGSEYMDIAADPMVPVEARPIAGKRLIKRAR